MLITSSPTYFLTHFLTYFLAYFLAYPLPRLPPRLLTPIQFWCGTYVLSHQKASPRFEGRVLDRTTIRQRAKQRMYTNLYQYIQIQVLVLVCGKWRPIDVPFQALAAQVEAKPLHQTLAYAHGSVKISGQGCRR